MYKIALPLIALGLSACATKTMDAPMQDAPMSAACTAQSQAIFFQTGSDDLDANATATLDNISALYAGCDLFRIDLTGYADSVGDNAANLELSNDRADAVLQSLLARGVTADRIRIVPLGERTIPDTGNPSAFERRVVVSLTP